MGLILSVLVACVGVIELIAFYHNVQRNITSLPVRGDLSRISDGFRKELRGIQHRLDQDLHTTKDIGRPSTGSGIPTFRLNSHEDIEVEYEEKLLRSRSASPRSFLISEKEENRKSESPRRFVVSDDPETLKRSKSQDSIPEFLIHEQNNSPNKPRYVLREQQDESHHPIPLPRQFIVTENEINTLVFDQTCRPDENQYSTDRYRRSPSPYPPLELPPHVPRNSICSDLLENPTFSVVEFDEDDGDSSISTPGKVDVILESTSFNTTQYWTNKVLVAPSKHHTTRSRCHGVHKKTDKKCLAVSERARSKSESENKEPEEDAGVSNNRAVSNLELNRKADEDNSRYDEEYLNSLDGISKAKLNSNPSRRAFIKRKHTSGGSFERAKSSIEESPNEATTKTLSKAVEELKKFSDNDVEEKSKGEPFWVKQ